jgi:cyclin-dependent kinase 7
MLKLADHQGHTQLPDYHVVGDYPKSPWWQYVSSLGKDGQDLTRELLKFDPKARVSARQALHHRYFTSLPRPTPPIKLPKPLAELAPRALAPDETQGKPLLKDGSSGEKRKAESPRQLGKEEKKVARRLFH